MLRFVARGLIARQNDFPVLRAARKCKSEHGMPTTQAERASFIQSKLRSTACDNDYQLSFAEYVAPN